MTDSRAKFHFCPLFESDLPAQVSNPRVSLFLASWPDDFCAGDALDNHGEAQVGQIDRQSGDQVGDADGGEVEADRANREAGVGASVPRTRRW
jgi:hypothetical protein